MQPVKTSIIAFFNRCFSRFKMILLLDMMAKSVDKINKYYIILKIKSSWYCTHNITMDHCCLHTKTKAIVTHWACHQSLLDGERGFQGSMQLLIGTNSKTTILLVLDIPWEEAYCQLIFNGITIDDTIDPDDKNSSDNNPVEERLFGCAVLKYAITCQAICSGVRITFQCSPKVSRCAARPLPRKTAKAWHQLSLYDEMPESRLYFYVAHARPMSVQKLLNAFFY